MADSFRNEPARLAREVCHESSWQDKTTVAEDPVSFPPASERKMLKHVQRGVNDTPVRYIADFSRGTDIKANLIQVLNSTRGRDWPPICFS